MCKKLIISIFAGLLSVVTMAQQKNINLCYAGQIYQFGFNTNPDSTNFYMSFPNQSSNVWEVGKTNKPFFTSGGFGNLRGVMTDTINPYPINTNSVFEFSVVDCFPYQSNGIRVTLQYRIDSDSLLDGTLIEYSHSGQAWVNAASLSGGTYGGGRYITYSIFCWTKGINRAAFR